MIHNLPFTTIKYDIFNGYVTDARDDLQLVNIITSAKNIKNAEAIMLTNFDLLHIL